MTQLRQFNDLLIDWDLTPEEAVTMYLEWGNNNWHAPHPPVRGKEDFSTYFVVDNWGDRPQIRLVRRNSEEARDLATVEIPEDLVPEFVEETGGLKGVFHPTRGIKNWLRHQLDN